MRAPPQKPVRRRHVLYFHGFDPAPTERYRRIFARAAAARRADDGGVEVSEVETLSPLSEGWCARSATGVDTICECLRYGEVVRAWRRRPILTRIATGVGSWALYMITGAWRRVLMRARGPALLFQIPICALTGFVLLGSFLGRLAGDGAAALGAPEAAGPAFRAAGVAAMIWWSARRAEKVLFAYLMLGLMDVLRRLGDDARPADALDAAVDRFADHIVARARAAAADPAGADEILVVGHSLGGWTAVAALARALERAPEIADGPPIGLITLGSVAGFVTAGRGAGARRHAAEIEAVASDRRIFWLDVSAPRDLFSFALRDPLLLIPKPGPDARSPLVISAKFGRAAPDPEDARTRFPAMRLHMRYLEAPSEPGAFDYVATVTAPRTLGAQYAGRRASPRARMLRR